MPGRISMISGNRGRPRGRPFRLVLALPALAALAGASPPSAAQGLHLVAVCTAEGPRLVALDGGDPAGVPGDGRERAQMACAHALCPREVLPAGKARGRT
jgi:hypothetical protein